MVEVDPIVKVDPIEFDPSKTCKLISVIILTVQKTIQFKNAFRIALACSGTEINCF